MTTDPSKHSRSEDQPDPDHPSTEVYGHVIDDGNSPIQPSRSMSEWLNRLTVSLVGEAKQAPKAGDQGIIYSLKLGKEKSWGSDIAIGIGVAKRLKSGLWGAPKDITNACAPPDSIRPAYQDIDHQLARELMATTHAKDGYYYYRNKALNAEPESGDLLQRIIATGRARLVGKGPVQWGPGRKVSYSYVSEQEGLWRVCLKVLRGRVLLTCPPAISISTSNSAAPLTILSRGLSPCCTKPPVISEEELAAVHPVLQQFLPALVPPQQAPPAPPKPSYAYALIDGYTTLQAHSHSQHWDIASEALLPLVRYGSHLLPLGDQRPTSPARWRSDRSRSRERAGTHSAT